MRKRSKKVKKVFATQKMVQSEIFYIGWTDEWGLLLPLGTKNKNVAIKRAGKIIDQYDRGEK